MRHRGNPGAEVDVLVVGSGVAGLGTAVRSAAHGLGVVVLTKGETGHSATRYAQGGVAAALDPADSPELHLSDTLAAGAGLCDPEAARMLVTEGPRRVRELAETGATFDATGDGGAAALALAREGGHSTARVVHAGGDATGAEIERALVAALDATGVEVRERWFSVDLLVEGGVCRGVVALDPGGAPVEVRARHTVLATGGAGQLYSVTTNPPPSTGDGTAMALRAGVPVADLEFMQFHPTALHRETIPRPLLSEAVRGEGAVLRDDRGAAFMAAEHALADLAPRDVVARALMRRMLDRGVGHLWLDATGVDGFAARFPTITRACRESGLDPARDWLPVAPAAHYHCGGVVTDLDGAATLAGLWAVGEAACTGAHGANRLASNSLLEGLVFAPRAVEAIVGGRSRPERTGLMRAVLDAAPPARPGAEARRGPETRPGAGSSAGAGPSSTTGRRAARQAGGARGIRVGGARDVDEARRLVQERMTEGAGVLRDASSRERTRGELEELGRSVPGAGAGAGEVADLVDVGAALCRAASARAESRGAHTREDRTGTDNGLLGRFVHAGNGLEFVPSGRHGAVVP